MRMTEDQIKAAALLVRCTESEREVIIRKAMAGHQGILMALLARTRRED